MGVYQLIFSVFVTAVTFSTAGIHLLSMRLTTGNLSVKEGKHLRSALSRCLCYGLSISTVAACSLCIGAHSVACYLLSDPRVENALRILAAGLPFMACCSVFKGYFTAVKKTIHCATADIMEQLVTMGVPFLFFCRSSGYSLQTAVEVIMFGSTLGEAISFFYTLLIYRMECRKYEKRNTTKIGEDIRHIALPCTFASTARTLLSTAENLLIPYGLRANGASTELSLGQYGMIQGMAFPTLVFPSSILLPFSSLLVPELAETMVKKEKKTQARLISKALRWTLRFSLFVSCVLFVYAKDLGKTLYQSETVGIYIRLLAPLVLLLYADSVVDGMLKGLDQQVASCKYNIIDGALRVLLIGLLVPRFGLGGYVVVIFFSTIFNAALSFSKLIKVSQVVIPLLEYIFLPLLYSVLSVSIPLVIGPGALWIKIIFSAVIYGLLMIIERSFGKTNAETSSFAEKRIS
jgi:stage V sporulation protein B